MPRFLSLVTILFLFAAVNLSIADEGARVEVFAPRGTVKGVRQVSVRFSEPMTTFGDPRNETPFDIECPEKGAGRWADVKNWVFDFDRNLPAGISCTFRLREGLRALSGNVIGGERRFSFTTGGPAIISSNPADGRTIEEDQIFLLTLDGEADEKSVLANARFSVEGMPETIGIRIVTGEERAVVLKAAGHSESPLILTIRCRRNFPNKAKVKLVWGRGIASKTGVATTEDQVVEFSVRERFTVSFRCDRTKADAPCIPMLPMRLDFSSSVPYDLASKIVMKSGKKLYRPDLTVEGEEGEGVAARTGGTVQGVRFNGPFPENSSFVIRLPKGFRDDAGRQPGNRDRFPLRVATGSFPPLAKFAAPFGIIELNGDGAVPVTLRNLEPNVRGVKIKADDPKKAVEERPVEKREPLLDRAKAVKDKIVSMITGAERKKGAESINVKSRLLPLDREESIIQWLRKVRSARRNRPLLAGKDAEEFVIEKPGGGKAFEVVGIPLKRAGFHVIEIESPLLGAALLDKPRPMYVSTSALVTNMSAHFKWGRESSLVWVTSLDKGEPVAGVDVHIRDCKGKLHWQGRTDADGIARIKSGFSQKIPYCSLSRSRDNDDDYTRDNEQPMLQGTNGGLFVFARKGDDLTFVHSSWDNGIESWRFNLPYASFMENTIAHTVFDRTLVRAGDTIHMKHFMRNHTMKGFDLRKIAGLPRTAVVMHRGSGQRYEFPLTWKADNSAVMKMTVPKGAELGFYDVYLSKEPPKKKGDGGKGSDYVDGWKSGAFRVEEFRIPLMKGVVEPPKEPVVNASSVELDLYVSHLSGGGAGGEKVRLRSQVKPRYVSFDDYEDYTFANGKVETGVVKEESPDWYSFDGDEEDIREEHGKKPTYGAQDLVLDKAGALRARIDGLPKIDAPHDLVAELEFRDPNGEIQTVTGRVPLWSSKLLVGVKPESWASSAESLKFKAVVVDLKGRPVTGAMVSVELLNRSHFSHRKRLVGGFYSYEQVTETKSLGQICEGATDERGILDCAAKSPVSGNVVLQASVVDDRGASSTANRDVWVAGKGEWWFEAGDSDRIDLLPEKRSYDPGETARFQVRSPFRSATALITVEREGIIDAGVKRLSGREPVISVPVKGSYAPNVFVSALCVRGRVKGTAPTAMFDPGKPSYRLGIAEIRVGRKEHELKVKVAPDRDSYRVREKAKIRIKVSGSSGGKLPGGGEVALAVVDEGLLELMPNDSWKLLEAMMGRRGYEVGTSTAQTQVVGRRHYGLKALPAGGGGGMRSTRELFDTLLAWKGRVRLDGKGEATVVVPLNDSITSFAVVAVASAGKGLFGTGRAAIRTTQDLMIMSGLPPLVRQGDRFAAGFTVRNASDRDLSLNVAAIPSWSKGKGFDPVPLKLAPGEAKEVSWQAEAPAGIENAVWEAEAREENGVATDRIRVVQRMIPPVPVRVYQATVTRLERPVELDMKPPDDAVKGMGRVGVSLQKSLSQGLEGVQGYMRDYPWSCMEQMVSRAISLRDDGMWKRIESLLPSYLDGEGLVKFFPAQSLEGSPVLTSYILSISSESGRELPKDLVERMENGLVKFIEGKIRRESSFHTPDLAIRKLAAVEALSRRGKAGAKLLSSVAIEPNLWPTSALLDWLNILKKTEDIPDRRKRLDEAEIIIRSRLNFQGTVMNFSTEKSDRLWWLMVSTDTNALRALLAFMDGEKWRGDVPRLVRGALARQEHGRWETTVANAWGVVALDRYTRLFEATPVTGTTRVEMDGAVKSVEWKGKKMGETLSFPWGKGGSKLGLRHGGGGTPWAVITATAAIPLREPLSSGYRIRKTLIPVEQREKGSWSRGDTARVRLEIEAQSDMTWVAVSDPVPAGSTILGSGLMRDSAIVSEGGRDRTWPVYEERGFEGYRAYYDFIPKGRFIAEYTVRFNNEGRFRMPTTRVEALYAPEMFGELPNRTFKVEE